MATLGELMGRAGDQGVEKKFTISDLKDLLGESMPKLEFSAVGRIRMMNALRGRFGKSFRNLPGISDIIKDFDDEAGFRVRLEKMRQIKVENQNG